MPTSLRLSEYRASIGNFGLFASNESRAERGPFPCQTLDSAEPRQHCSVPPGHKLAHRLLIHLLKAPGHRTGASLADRLVVDTNDRKHLRSGSRQKELGYLRQVAALQYLFTDRNARLGRQPQNEAARDPR